MSQHEFPMAEAMMPMPPLPEQPVPAENLTLRQRLASTPLGRAVVGAACAVGILAGGLAEASPAAADASNVQVYNTGNQGLWLHSGSANLDSSLSDLMPDGTSFTVKCWETSDNVLGDTLWDYGTDNTTGDTGFAADYYLTTNDTQGSESAQLTAQGIPECGSTPAQPPTPAPNPSTPHYAGNCKDDIGAEIVESWNNALDSINDDGEFKSQLEQWDTLWGNPGEDDVCVGAQFSDPDHINHRQFVGAVVAASPDLDPPGCGEESLVEIWGDGFYKTTTCTDPTKWNINKWLESGTYVCAAISQATDMNYYKDAADADAAVASGKVKLGSADPEREITCVEVKA